MQLPVKIRKGESGVAEWTIIELQGSLETHGNPIQGQHIGDLSYTKEGVPILVIGHHALFGKETVLEKPYAVMAKSQDENGVSYSVQALVKQKIVFKTRPKPIVTQNLK